jgi:hypothetical protein
MKLYILPTSPNSRKVLAVIHHLGLKPKIVCLDFASADTAKPEFMALNPNGVVPVLVDGTFRLWESNAINQYLVEKAGGSSLFPRDPQSRADITRWQFWEQAHFNRAFGTLIFESVVKPKFGLGEASAGLVEFCLREIGRFAKVARGASPGTLDPGRRRYQPGGLCHGLPREIPGRDTVRLVAIPQHQSLLRRGSRDRGLGQVRAAAAGTHRTGAPAGMT